MADLRIDVGAMIDLGNELTRVAHEFSDANSHSTHVADAVGHHGLHDAVRDFAHNWDDKRTKMTGDIEKLATFATPIGDNVHSTDTQLADAVDGSNPSAGGPR